MRLFFAIELPDNVRCALAQAQTALRAGIRGRVSWVRPEKFHLTMKFLGDCEDRQVEMLHRALSVQLLPPFLELSLSGPIRIPDRSRTRVIASAVSEPKNDITRLFRILNDMAAQVGLPSEGDRFTPHVTLGRVRPPRTISPAELASCVAEWMPARFVAADIALIQSILSGRGSRYQRLATFPLHPGESTVDANARRIEGT